MLMSARGASPAAPFLARESADTISMGLYTAPWYKARVVLGHNCFITAADFPPPY